MQSSSLGSAGLPPSALRRAEVELQHAFVTIEDSRELARRRDGKVSDASWG
jgi:hypothetical protein